MLYESSHILDVLGGPQDGASQGCALEGSGMQVVKDHLLQVGLHLLHLSQDDATLSLYLLLSQQAVLGDVRQDIHRWWQKTYATEKVFRAQ